MMGEKSKKYDDEIGQKIYTKKNVTQFLQTSLSIYKNYRYTFNTLIQLLNYKKYKVYNMIEKKILFLPSQLSQYKNMSKNRILTLIEHRILPVNNLVNKNRRKLQNGLTQFIQIMFR